MSREIVSGEQRHELVSGKSFIKYASGNSDLRLFCFPYAGGSASVFRNWGTYLSNICEVYCAQLPSREHRAEEPFITDILSLAENFASAMCPLVKQPYVIFGHSLGALLGYETIRALRRSSQPQPLHLVVSGRRAPHIADRVTTAHLLPDDEFIAELRRLNGTPESLLNTPQVMKYLLPLLRADFTLFETYQHHWEQPLNCYITVYGGKQDNEASPAQLDAWRYHTKNVFQQRMFSGGHFFVRDEEELLLKCLTKDITHSYTQNMALTMNCY